MQPQIAEHYTLALLFLLCSYCITILKTFLKPETEFLGASDIRLKLILAVK